MCRDLLPSLVGIFAALVVLELSAQESMLVSLEGREVEVVRMGVGSPVLVLESGAGESARQWNRLLPELAKQTQVISYSRAGFGRSTAYTEPGSPQRSVGDLHDLLELLEVPAPIILVGHSWGGLLARLYVSTFPTEVAGLVLIDSTHEASCAHLERLEPAFRCTEMFRAAVADAPPPVRDLYEQVITAQSQWRIEGMNPLPDMPLAVITAAKPCPPTELWLCWDPRALGTFRRLHDEWALQSTTSLRIVSAKTGHYVMNDQPKLIEDAVEFVLDQVRGP